jgi:hypothetical protein
MDTTQPEGTDWFLPAVLVAIAGTLVLIAAIAFGIQSDNGDGSPAEAQLELWSSCLRSEGANVPLAEVLDGGGFRITLDGSLVEEGIDWETLGPALDECEDQAPEEVLSMMVFVEGLVESLDEDIEMFEDFHDSELFGFMRRHGGPPFQGEIDEMELSQICEQIERGGIEPDVLSRHLRRACRQSADG